MFKLIATDLDGTLLDNNSKVPKENREILKKFREKGGHVVIATGRTLFSTEPIIEELGLDSGFAIVYNGAKIVNLESKEVFYHSSLDRESIPHITKISRELGVHLNLYVEDDWFVEDGTNQRGIDYALHCGKEPLVINFDELRELNMTKALFIGNRDELDIIYDKIFNILGDSVHLCFSSNKYLEVLPKNVNKGAALKKVLDFLNLSLEQCVAFGDEMNDIEMLLSVGHGVAMGNANPLVKEQIKNITTTNEECGVYQFLKDKI